MTEVNDALEEDPALVNSSPEEDGCFFRLSISDSSELKGLMDEAGYRAFLDSV